MAHCSLLILWSSYSTIHLSLDFASFLSRNIVKRIHKCLYFYYITLYFQKFCLRYRTLTHNLLLLTIYFYIINWYFLKNASKMASGLRFVVDANPLIFDVLISSYRGFITPYVYCYKKLRLIFTSYHCLLYFKILQLLSV